MSKINPVNLFGSIPDGNPTYGQIIAEDLGLWQFKLYPQLWNDPGLQCVNGINWTKLKFVELDANGLLQIPIGSGVYYFTVEGRIDLFSCHSYLFYAGKAASGLRSRYEDYIQEREGEEPEEDRTKITKFLNDFRDHVYFHFCEFPKDQVASIESAIKDNLTPPANTILKLKGRLYTK